VREVDKYCRSKKHAAETIPNPNPNPVNLQARSEDFINGGPKVLSGGPSQRTRNIERSCIKAGLAQ